MSSVYMVVCFAQFFVFLEGLYPINLIDTYPLNENEPQLLATFENWGWKVGKQLLNFLAVFEHETLAT